MGIAPSTGNRPEPLPASGPCFSSLRPGRVSYGDALELQQELLERRRQLEQDILLLLEHPAVVTLGRGGKEEHLRLPEPELARRGIEVHRVGRGGDVTYHGPGQLVGYPIVDLTPLGRDLHRYLRLLEEVLLKTLASFGITGERVPGKTGVWVQGQKIASIGVAVRRWVTWHGFALNVASDLSGFASIVPCGLPGISMVSIERLLGRPVALADVEERVIHSFAATFSLRHAGALAGDYAFLSPKT